MARCYTPRLTVSVNRKGVLDVDTVKGCSLGMAAHPDGGCYGLCYAAKMARARGWDFTHSVSRPPLARDRSRIERQVSLHDALFFRIGTMGDPCHDWPLTLDVCEWLGRFKTPVIITKHWVEIFPSDIPRLLAVRAVVNTSISPLDTPREIAFRLVQFNRLKSAGVRSVLRIVSARFGDTLDGREWADRQERLFQNSPVIDNPLRISRLDPRVVRGDILVSRHADLGGGSTVSVAREDAYLGCCRDCPDQCGTYPGGESCRGTR